LGVTFFYLARFEEGSDRATGCEVHGDPELCFVEVAPMVAYAVVLIRVSQLG
jgi:hypothetical protein